VQNKSIKRDQCNSPAADQALACKPKTKSKEGMKGL
jgi:hypothetical protein